MVARNTGVFTHERGLEKGLPHNLCDVDFSISNGGCDDCNLNLGLVKLREQTMDMQCCKMQLVAQSLILYATVYLRQ